jgi:type I restriction enzyme, R subunit
MIGAPERQTQDRIVRLFCDELGYDYLGDWSDRVENRGIDEGLVTDWLTANNYEPSQINRAVHLLTQEATNHSRNLYDNNKAVYSKLRYGVDVKIDPSRPTEKVHLIDWKRPERNHFAIAEEVTLRGNRERRPDVVLYINGIALGVVELKNSRISIGDGIRQLLSNQQPDWNPDFFSTIQICFAGNDSEGLRYGTIGTPEKYYLRWKEDEQDNSLFKLDKYLLKMGDKKRFLELIYDFILFDGGVKKLPRPHQYFGVKAAQEHARRREGGIIWHTQGSGKSIVMVYLAKWILENTPNARVIIITDRDELDKQIAGVLQQAGVVPVSAKRTDYQATGGRDLMQKLAKPHPRLLCSLVHKFGKQKDVDFETFLKEIESEPTKAVGELFVFVDECHRTQSGKFHRVMKARLPNAAFIGFTGTPLLKKDKSSSLEIFGKYIHTYKFSEGVDDEVILDLVYEARDIDQELGSPDRVDAWFEAKTRGLNDWQKDELKKKWSTMQKVLSSRGRMERIVADIEFDFATKPRLASQRGNAILVASSIYEATKFYALFQKTPFSGHCALITSYNPYAGDVSKEETGANTQTDKQFIFETYEHLLKNVVAHAGSTKTETYEEKAKDKFIHEPAAMKLLIVVDKLLTGFDAPPCTYLYIDKAMQDHGLFQAVCRTNRLDGDDKLFGHVVSYKEGLFEKVGEAIAVYSSELDHSAPGADPEVLLQDRLGRGRDSLNDALEAMSAICEPVAHPRSELDYMHYFCGNTEIPDDLKDRESRREALYKGVASVVRAYANIADELERAGFTKPQQIEIKARVESYVALREIIRKASGEFLDLKPYEADMRHLLDTYVQAKEPRKISPFDNVGLLELIVKTGIANTIMEKLAKISGNRDAVAETIENNVRRKIVKEQMHDPAYFERMSKLLHEVITARKEKAIEYEEYLKRIAELAKAVQQGHDGKTPATINSPGKRALYNNLAQDAALVERMHTAILAGKPDGWRGVLAKEQAVKRILFDLLADADQVERIFPIIKAQTEY